ncbi:hypothetical protein C1922_12510 [Stenotrophomonas sp. ZAC14D2_NAIMI4_7]|uniref:hypothetical protein n=1 Tax=Stenotrophomonas sp. ZAC14D2_NAIMI4_7 TaxID=2072405 RepID=UPI000D53E311|nr:hypothetical protein [Stenotrophomonas sp. ZAC14D2_NAIMI4_7]AWH18064.1 hypothetical protein C1922_12510 [Stenotrophomonas sp. ZAC14D2_NAIMI4_7]
MRALLMLGLALLAGPALAEPPPSAPTSAWLERQQVAAADEANAAAATPSKKPEAKERCRVTKEWKVGQTVVRHRVCEDPPKKPAGKV